ncbi:hypothetical protein [Photorhabdus sp. RM71S]|uniref:hypothetical protein n=1 Tax=Photorhabdus sp. RM71S TaxID=3342824 RepID=UPI0036D86588
MKHEENPVSHLLWCMLIALRTAHDDNPFTSENARRKFLNQWLSCARRVPTFSGLPREFSTLRELLIKDRNVPIDGVLSALWEQSVLNEQCDFIRFRNAKNTLFSNKWCGCICRFPEETTPETMTRLHTRRNHFLQLTLPEDGFQATGQIKAPLTFQLVLNRQSDQFEEAFHSCGFAVMQGAEIECGRSSLVRTVYISMASLPEAVWGAQPANLWTPQYH